MSSWSCREDNAKGCSNTSTRRTRVKWVSLARAPVALAGLDPARCLKQNPSSGSSTVVYPRSDRTLSRAATCASSLAHGNTSDLAEF